MINIKNRLNKIKKLKLKEKEIKEEIKQTEKELLDYIKNLPKKKIKEDLYKGNKKEMILFINNNQGCERGDICKNLGYEQMSLDNCDSSLNQLLGFGKINKIKIGNRTLYYTK